MRKGVRVTLLSLAVSGIAAFAYVNSARVAPLRASDKALTTCPLHGVPLELGTARILYGDRGPVIDFAITARAFPDANSYVFGGCLVDNGSPTWQTVKFCPKCREAEQSWLDAHHKEIPRD